MPTIPQLPSATEADSPDELPISQDGITRSVTVAQLLSGTQPALELPSPSVLGRASLGPGGPEALSVGIGLGIQSAAVIATGADHAGFALESSFGPTDNAIVDAAGTPRRLPLTALRGLFSAGSNVAISGPGAISASTDPGVTSSLGTLSQGLAALNAKIPAGGVAGLNGSGQVTAPIAGDVSLGTVAVGSTGVARTLARRGLDALNVLDFGAVTGGPDCTAGFNAAFAQLPNNGGEIFIPAGDYWLVSPLVFAGKAVAIRGAGKGQTRLHFQHTGIGLDFAPGNVLSKVVLRDLSGYAESQSGQTGALARISYPTIAGFGYVSAVVDSVECFGYPNAANGITPFPQTFLRGLVIDNCWSTQISNLSWFGPPAAAGATLSAAIELNKAVDTRIHALQAYYGNAVVLQTGYCEGIYLTNPLVVGADYFFRQTDETTWVGYMPNKPMLLGLWAANGEVNTSLGCVQLDNLTIGFFANLDISRNGGPNTPQVLFDMTNVSNIHVSGCNFVGGPVGGNSQDTAFSFNSTYNSSSNIIEGCHFEDMATVISIVGGNGTVGLTTYGLHLGNVPLSTAIIDPTAAESGNYISFMTPSQTGVPAAIGSSKDHLFTGTTGAVLFRINNVAGAANFLRHQPATATNPPTLAFDGNDGTVNGVIQTKGGSLFINAAGGTSGSGNLISLLNTPGATNWPVVQNATSGNLSLIKTNSGGLGLQPQTALWLSPGTGLFMAGLPTTRPTAGSQQVWNNGGVLSIA